MSVQHPGHIPIHLNSQGVSELLSTNGSVLLVRDHRKETSTRIDSLVTALCKRIHRLDGQYVGHVNQIDATEVDPLKKLITQYGRKHFLVLTRGGRDPLPLPSGVGIGEVEEAIQKEKLGGLMLPDNSAEGIAKLQAYTPEQQIDLQRGVRAVKRREREVGESPLGSAPVFLRTAAEVQAFAKSPGGAIFMLRDDDHTVAYETQSSGTDSGIVLRENIDDLQTSLHPALRAGETGHVLLTSTNASGKTQIHKYTGAMEAHSVIGALADLRKAL